MQTFVEHYTTTKKKTYFTETDTQQEQHKENEEAERDYATKPDPYKRIIIFNFLFISKKYNNIICRSIESTRGIRFLYERRDYEDL